MPRVNRQRKNKAGRDRTCGRCGKLIEPGQEYLTWSFRYGGTQYRCTDHPPRPSELTQSKLSEVYAAIEGAEDEFRKGTLEPDDIQVAVHGVAETVREVASEYEEAAEHFGGEGENQERAEELEGWADELEEFEIEEPDEDDDEEEARDWLAEAEEAISGCPL